MPLIVDTTDAGRRTFLDMQNEVLAYGFDQTVYRARVKNWLNEAVHRIRRRARIAEGEQPATITTAAGTAEYDLPAAAIRIRSLRSPSEAAALEAVSIDELDELSETGSGAPAVYALHGDKIELRPVPDAGYTLELRYWSNSDRMVDDGDVPGLPDDYLDVPIAYALAEAYAAEDDPEMSNFHRGRYEGKLLELLSDLQKRQTDRVRQVGDRRLRSRVGPRVTRP